MNGTTNASLNPFKYLRRTKSTPDYQQIPAHEETDTNLGLGLQNGNHAIKRSPSIPPPTKRSRFSRFCKLPPRIWLPSIIIALLLLGFLYQPDPPTEEQIHEKEKWAHKDEPKPAEYFWKVFTRLNGYYNGVDTLIPWNEWTPEEVQRDMYEAMPYSRPQGSAPPPPPPPPEQQQSQHPAEAERREVTQISRRDLDPTTSLPLMPELYNPYPHYTSDQYLSQYHHVEPCFLDVNDSQIPPDIFVYPGVGQHATLPFFGSYEEIGLRQDVCFERIGRYGPYGYAYGEEDGGLGIGLFSERRGAHDVWNAQNRQNWTGMNWGAAQDRCLEKNQHRFNTSEEAQAGTRAIKKKVPRTAFVFRTWTGYEYTPTAILTLRSTINELAIKSGGEYHVYLLLHVRDDSIPIWASDEEAQKVIQKNVPEEFWGITTLWSVQQMRMYYPGPFEQTFENPSGADIHEVYRGNHFPLQWFSATHPEYDFVWNWEMDMRYSGHHYEFHNQVSEWAKAQPRRGLWERNQKLWIPSYHGNWTNFTRFVDEETIEQGEVPVWGPVSFPTEHKMESPPETKPPTSWLKDDFKWGVGEEADLITFDPIFDPGRSNWVFRDDITGFSLALPIPPRRCAIVTVSRLSRRLLDIMHKETYSEKHSAFPEMWPPTVALHHGLKAVYIPHPVYFDRKWPLEYLDKTFNYPKTQWESVYGWGEHNFIGSTFYFNAGFAGALWRRWLGQRENDEGGHVDEIQESNEKPELSTVCDGGQDLLFSVHTSAFGIDNAPGFEAEEELALRVLGRVRLIAAICEILSFGQNIGFGLIAPGQSLNA